MTLVIEVEGGFVKRIFTDGYHDRVIVADRDTDGIEQERLATLKGDAIQFNPSMKKLNHNPRLVQAYMEAAYGGYNDEAD